MTVCLPAVRNCSRFVRTSAAIEKATPAAGDLDSQLKAARAEIDQCKLKLQYLAQYISKRAEMTFSALKMNRVEISLYDVVKSTGEVKDTFKFTYNGRRYDWLSLSEKIRAGMEVSELMKRLTGRNYPTFVDNMESVDDLTNVRPTGQVIMAKCVSKAELSVRPVKPILTQCPPPHKRHGKEVCPLARAYEKIPIVDTARRCGLVLDPSTLRRREVEASCPFCGDHGKGKYHLSLNVDTDQYRCNLCGVSGNSVSLHARLHGLTNKEAYMELSGAATYTPCPNSPAPKIQSRSQNHWHSGMRYYGCALTSDAFGRASGKPA